MLNQTNIGHNNNKYYVIQVIELDGHYYTWTRWGRVGEPGANAIKGPTTQENAVKEFTKKFYDKTRNKWESRDSFQTVAGQYTLLDMGDDDEDGGEDTTDSSPQVATTVKESDCLPSSLDKPTQDLVKLIFDNNMFQDALKDLEIDTKKMPLGKLSKTQIAKGFEALEQIEQALEKNEKSKLAELSSQFYTVIPHDFGRKLPPTINSMELLRKKMDMLMVLADIELAQSMQKGPDKDVQQEKCAKPRHPLDRQYDLLQCRLSLLDKTSGTYKILEKYMRATQCEYRKPLEIISIWELERNSEAVRFAVYSSIENRKLLWHGTNVAVVAAILKSGLRIMPHSGGRVGRGIYFASENGKSAGYVRSAQGGIGIMFLSEVALGKEHHITQDNSSLKMAPKGFDSIIAKGRTEPDPKLDAKIELDGHTVIVPQGPPIRQDKFSNSSFSQSEYLIYREDQCRLRYILELKFAY
jgi:poly [ADP-ribose] polymerase